MNRNRRNDEYKHFDVVEVYEPEYEHVRKWISLPRKTIYINRAATREAKVIRIGWSRNDDVFRLPFE